MREKSYTPRSAWRIALIAATLTVGACDAVNQAVDAINDIGNNHTPSIMKPPKTEAMMLPPAVPSSLRRSRSMAYGCCGSRFVLFIFTPD